MIYIELMGGLGNQLFQIFCGIAYSFDNRIAFKIKAEKFDKVSPLDNTSLRPTYWNNLLDGLSRFAYNNSVLMWVYREQVFFKYNKIPHITEDFRLYGYFQSYKYFENQFANICRIIRLEEKRREISAKYIRFFERLDSKRPVSLHFRIGDYVKNPAMHPVLSVEYYIKALLSLNNKLVDFQNKFYILYFGEIGDDAKIRDNIRIIKERLSGSGLDLDLEFVICDYEIADWEQMLIMSLSSHNIIANSSFSWWGAYLCERLNIERFVCYPSIWTGSTNNLDDLFPQEWLKIS